MKKSLYLLANLLVVAALVGLGSGRLQARQTGTATGTDAGCWGVAGVEICVDSAGNLVPTTTGVGNLGTTSLKFNAVNATSQAISGNQIKTPVALQAVAAGGTISVTGACGGLLRIGNTTGGSVTTDTTNTFTAPAAATLGCLLYVVNEGTAGLITLDKNTLTQMPADTVLGTNDGAIFIQGTSAWIRLGTSDN